MSTDLKWLIEQGDELFGKRTSLMAMWQEMADQFYPERADFTASRSLGTDFAAHLTTSYPLTIRRDLGNSLGTMQRPSSIDWFAMRTEHEEDEDQPAKAWMERASGIMRRAMYHRTSQFQRASKEGDHDIATFGQCVKSVELNRHADGLLYRCWHLRDCAWNENEDGAVGDMHRKWMPTAYELQRIFGGMALHANVRKMLEPGSARAPFTKINCRHIVIPAELCPFDSYPGKGRAPFVSIYMDVENKHLIECVGQVDNMYAVPRWQTVSGSQYAFSPATVCALPDARLIQAMTLTLLEAGEKAVNPPMVAQDQVVRGDVPLYAGGITWVDADYDERLGDAIRPLSQDKSGLPFGMEMRDGLMAILREAFFLNTLTMPQNGPEMTAYEVGQRVQDYIRQAAPIFEPLEAEDNGAICEKTFNLMMRHGAFGSVEDIPESLRGREIGFKFKSPLHDAVEAQKGSKFFEASQILSQAVSLYPDAPAHLNFEVAFRDALTSTGMPAAWLNSETDAQAIIEGNHQQEQAAALLQNITAGAEAAKSVGEAGQALGPEALAA